MDPEIAHLVPRFLANRIRDCARLREAFAAQDMETLRRTGHSLKGAGNGYGLPVISGIGERIEQATTTDDLEALAAAIDELCDYVHRVRLEPD